MKNWKTLKIGDWATDCYSAFPDNKNKGKTFLILKIGESSIDTDEGVGYFNAFFDESHEDHIDYNCRPATRVEIETECQRIYDSE